MMVGPDAIVDLETFTAQAGRTWTLFRYETLARRPAIVFASAMLAAIALALGLATKLALVVCFVIWTSILNRNKQLTNSGHALAAILMWFCLFSPIGATMSLDSHFPWLQRFDVGWSWGFRMCQCQITIMYLLSACQKLLHKDWRAGLIAYKVTSLGFQRTRVPMPRVFAILAVSKALTYSVLAAEVVLPILLWFETSASFAIVALAAMHLGMSAFLDVGTFSFYAIAGTMLFLPPAWLG